MNLCVNAVADLPGMREIWQESTGDSDIVIAVLDGRVDLSHSSFDGAEVTEIDPAWLHDRLSSRVSVHGTHVASVLFGQHNGPVEGIAPRCRGILIPVYGEDEHGDLIPCSQADLARAIALAKGEGAHIINVSGGQLTPTGEAERFLAEAVRSCASQDIVIVAATGNDGGQCSHVPAVLPSVLAVGAADAGGEPLGFSNWGESLRCNGILAPGKAIKGAVPENGVELRTGTSFATPIVAGVAALLLSLQKRRGHKPSPLAVRDALLASAIPCLAGEDDEVCERMLAGRLNISGAYAHLFETEGGNVGTSAAPDVRAPYVVRSPPPARPPPSAGAHSGVMCHGLNQTRKEANTMADQHDHVEPQSFDLGNMIAQLQGLAGQLQEFASQRPPPNPRAGDEVPSKERAAPYAEDSRAAVAVPPETAVAPAAQNATSPGSPSAVTATAPQPTDRPAAPAVPPEPPIS